jgi:tetratricopeptide (TPR) repeat protein/predicted Ser/Thr protein kinase
MDDSNRRNYEHEAATLVPGAGAAAGRAREERTTAVQTPVPGSANESAGFSDPPTLLDGAAPPPNMPSGTPTVEHVSPGTAPTLLTAAALDASRNGVLNGMLLQPGTVLANRYEIVKVLGEGGMGAVYKARDLELEREVALKVIRPELANNPEILQRFKQELILARQVTDRNVIRIFDLGDAGKIKFITMEYLDGESLHQILRQRGKLEVAEAVDIMEQMANGLAAAHREGIIHRDLKPGNIMRDKNGRVVVMDFGLARTLGGDGITQTGAMLGTIEYMSPEQAQGAELKASSDIFTTGLILYELLTGSTPFHAESVIASLLKRTQERAIPLTEIDKNIPGVLSNIVSKCLEKDPTRRYQTAEELVADLRAWQGKSGTAKVSASTVRLWMNRIRELPWPRVAATGALIVFTAAGVGWYVIARQQAAKVAPHKPVSILVGDFQNNTGDSLFDGTLEPMFNVALEGASFISAYNRGSARKAAAGLPKPSQVLDEQTSQLVAVKEGIAAIVTGALSKHGDGYALSVQAIDAVTGKTLATADVNAANKDDLLLQVPKLAVPIRRALGDKTPKSAQLAEEQGTVSTSSLEALHEYSHGMELQFQGKPDAALQAFSKAAQLDPNFARAYSGMAAASGNLGKLQDAENYAKQAMQHVDLMTERERYRIRGMYYIYAQSWQKCVEEYSELLGQYPADNIGHANLAVCYARMMDMPKAMEEARRGLQITPNDLLARMNFAVYACYAADFASCEQGAQNVLQINSSDEEAFLVLAYSQLGRNQLSQAADTYQKLEKISALGESFGTAGLGDLSLYQGKFREAAQILEKGAAQDLAGNKGGAAASKLLMLGYAELSSGEKTAAAAAADRALASSQTAKVRFMAARTYVEAGQTAKAQKLADGLGADIQTSHQAFAKLILGEIALQQKNANQAIQAFTDAKNLSDTWFGRFDLGQAYLQAGAFAEADSEFDRCIKRRGEVLELFMDDAPTYSYLPPVYYAQGRDHEGLKSPDFADSYRTYLSIRGQSTEDPLVPELKHKVNQ